MRENEKREAEKQAALAQEKELAEQLQKVKEMDLQKTYEAAKKQHLDEINQREQRFIDKIDKLNSKLKDIEKQWNETKEEFKRLREIQD